MPHKFTGPSLLAIELSAARRGQCAGWLNADTTCVLANDHWPATWHRGYDPSGSGRYLLYAEWAGRAIQLTERPIESGSTWDVGHSKRECTPADQCWQCEEAIRKAMLR